MVIINPNTPLQPAAYNRPAGPAPVMPTDRVLMAVVTGQRASHLYELASGNLRLMAESQTALRQGEQLQLRVTGHDANNRPQLEILTRGTPDILPLIKSTLPLQQGLNQLSSNLIAHFRHVSNPAIAAATEQFIASLPGRQQLFDPATLQALLRNAGLFMEARLARGENVSGDIKTALLKLARQLEMASSTAGATGTSATHAKLTQHYAPALAASLLDSREKTGEKSGKSAVKAYQTGAANTARVQNLPGDIRPLPRIAPGTAAVSGMSEQAATQHLLALVRGALARQDAHQLLQLQTSDAHKQQFTLELPVADRDGIDVWQLHIEQRLTNSENNEAAPTAGNLDAEHQWTITLSFDFPDLGPTKAVIQQKNDHLFVNFSAEQPSTAAMIDAARSELSMRLQEQGIPDATIRSVVGSARGPDSPLHDQHLLEDQA